VSAAQIRVVCVEHAPLFPGERPNIPGARKSQRKPTQRQPTLRFRFVQIVEWIVQRHAPDASEPCLLTKLTNLRFARVGALAPEGQRGKVPNAQLLPFAFKVDTCSVEILLGSGTYSDRGYLCHRANVTRAKFQT
jgi:hypothetical protein